MIFEVIPHVGIGPIKLGMNKHEVINALGKNNFCSVNDDVDYYFENSIQIEYLDNQADFIGVASNDKYTINYKNQNVFDITAKQLFAVMAKNEDSAHEFNAYEYTFPSQILTLWEADTQYDPKEPYEREIWGQVGIGTKSYLKAVAQYSDV